jgi:hypothetical protein
MLPTATNGRITVPEALTSAPTSLYPLPESAQPAGTGRCARAARSAACLRPRTRRAFGSLPPRGHDARPCDGAGEGFSQGALVWPRSQPTPAYKRSKNPSADRCAIWRTYWSSSLHITRLGRRILGCPHKSQRILSPFSYIAVSYPGYKTRPDRGRGPCRRRYRVNQDEQTQVRLAHHFTLRSNLQRGSI